MNIYLITSFSYKLLNQQLEKIVGDCLNVIKYDLKTNSLYDVINEANYFSFTNNEKIIVVKGGEIFKVKKKDNESSDEISTSKDIDILEKYIANPNPNVKIIFTSLEGADKRTKIYKLIKNNGNIIEIPELNKKDLTYKCIDLLKEKGYKTDYVVANYIVENSYVNYDIMINELEKIFIIIKAKTLTIEDLKQVISISFTNTTFAYVNAVINKKLKEAVKLSNNFELLKIDISLLLSLLNKEFMIYYMLLDNVNPKEMQMFYRKEDWQMNNYITNKSLYTKDEIKKIIIKLNDYDYKYKSGLIDKSVAIDLLTIDLCE